MWYSLSNWLNVAYTAILAGQRNNPRLAPRIPQTFAMGSIVANTANKLPYSPPSGCRPQSIYLQFLRLERCKTSYRLLLDSGQPRHAKCLHHARRSVSCPVLTFPSSKLPLLQYCGSNKMPNRCCARPLPSKQRLHPSTATYAHRMSHPSTGGHLTHPMPTAKAWLWTM
jgi:hypothetical protein